LGGDPRQPHAEHYEADAAATHSERNPAFFEDLEGVEVETEAVEAAEEEEDWERAEPVIPDMNMDADADAAEEEEEEETQQVPSPRRTGRMPSSRSDTKSHRSRNDHCGSDEPEWKRELRQRDRERAAARREREKIRRAARTKPERRSNDHRAPPQPHRENWRKGAARRREPDTSGTAQERKAERRRAKSERRRAKAEEQYCTLPREDRWYQAYLDQLMDLGAGPRRRFYYAEALRWHPDRPTGCADRFRALQTAYEFANQHAWVE